MKEKELAMATDSGRNEKGYERKQTIKQFQLKWRMIFSSGESINIKLMLKEAKELEL